MTRISAAFLLGATLLFGGCVEREIHIGSDPRGALVSLNDVAVGRTPLTVPMTWYGDYDVRITMEKNVGTPDNPKIQRYYLHTHRETVLPWFEIVGMDLVAELLPIPFKDEQVWAFEVPEVPAVPDKELLEHASELRDQLGAPDDLKNRK